MQETTGGKRSIEELEDAVLGALDLYFEALLHEVAGNPRRVGPAVGAYDEARRHLAEVEEELEGIRRRTKELKAGTVDAVVGGTEVSELGDELSELQEEVRALTLRRRRLFGGAKRTLKRHSGGRSWVSRGTSGWPPTESPPLR